MKALASEKLEELKQLGGSLGLEIGLGIGDAPNEAKQIDDCDILVCTSEKLDSLMRSKSEVLRRVSVVVADEFHLVNDSHRGPTMEINWQESGTCYQKRKSLLYLPQLAIHKTWLIG